MANARAGGEPWDVAERDDVTRFFGPVPSRRLGRSLGINTIPVKTCTYSCVYCQVGKTWNLTTERQEFSNPQEVVREVHRKLDAATSRGERVDYLTFVSDGEPTLDQNLGKELRGVQSMGIPVALLTNASLLGREDVKADVLAADFVSVKVDAVSAKLWRRINRPHRALNLPSILDGIIAFSQEFTGTMVTETMLLNGIPYGPELDAIAKFLGRIERLAKAYVAIPTRPPAEHGVKAAPEETVNTAFQRFAKHLGATHVEYLIGYEGTAFACTGDVVDDLLSITAVHPLRRDAVTAILQKADASWALIEQLLAEEKLVELDYEGRVYYMRTLPSRTKA